MINEDEFLFNLQSFVQNDFENFNIVEEQIDLDLQVSYFKRSKRLRKLKKTKEEVLALVPLLYEENTRIEEKRDVLIHLSSIDEVETYRAIEAYWKIAPNDMKPWASMAYRESKMQLESSLLDEKQVLISSGLGGKGQKLRYFLVFIHAQNNDFDDVQQKIIRNELQYALQDSESELENIIFENQLAKVFLLFPFTASIQRTIEKAVSEINQYGDFVSENFLVTNVKELESEEIFQIIQQYNENTELFKDFESLDLLDGIDFADDFDDEEDDDDF